MPVASLLCQGGIAGIAASCTIPGAEQANSKGKAACVGGAAEISVNAGSIFLDSEKLLL
jgi:hypothetical protein